MPHLSKADQTAQSSIYESRKVKEAALAKLRVLEVRRLEKHLVDADDVRVVWGAKLAGIKDRCLAIPDRLASQLAGRPEDEVRLILRNGIEAVLRDAYADL